MIFAKIHKGEQVSDLDFDQLYSEEIRQSSADHFTPVNVARAAAKYLSSKKRTKILDIGSGAGKFCLIGSTCTNGTYTGVEQRATLYAAARKIVNDYGLTNVHFLNANITTIDFRCYDAFYFYNSFQEHISPMDQINDEIELEKALYQVYSQQVCQQLDQMPIGTKLATYYSFLKEVPPSYTLQSTKFSKNLKFWKKVV